MQTTSHSKRCQRGQAIIEYVMVTLLCVLVLIVATDESPVIGDVKTAIKGFFQAFSYAISITPL